MEYIDRLKKDYYLVNDIVFKDIKDYTIIYIESLVSQDRINDYILKQLVNLPDVSNFIFSIPSPNVIKIKNYKSLLELLNLGFCIIIKKDIAYAIETKADINRSITNPTSEASIFGPKDSLIENIQVNLGLIKRRIKNYNLKNIDINIGKYTNTKTSILYIDSIAKIDIVNEVYSKLNNIDVDGFCDIGELKSYLVKDNYNVFPSIQITERPDVISRALLNGKIVILMDASSYALILPSFLADYINPITDNYSSSININFSKIIRFLCFFLSIILPGLYVALISYNHESIPLSLLINFQNQRKMVPYPSYVECFITLIICEILKESDIRFPSTYGSAISILGALVLGDAAVSAGIVSPIMIIIVAFSFIASMMFTDKDIVNGIRYNRFLCLILSSILGVFGTFIYLVFFLIYLSSKEYFNAPYFYPLVPFDLDYVKQTLLKMKTNKRSKLLSKNRIKEK